MSIRQEKEYQALIDALQKNNDELYKENNQLKISVNEQKQLIDNLTLQIVQYEETICKAFLKWSNEK